MFRRVGDNRQQIYYFDYENEERRLKEELNQALREQLFAFWLDTMDLYFEDTPRNMARWKKLKMQLSANSITVPDYPDRDKSFRTLIHGVLSAIHGKPVGWQFDTLIQVGHLLAEAHRENLFAFGCALKQAGHDDLLKKQDTTGKWERRKREFTPLMRKREPAYMPNPLWLPALSFLFPGVGKAVKSFLERMPIPAS